jgi:hypothetical protein
MIFVASLAAGLPNAAVLYVRSFTKGVAMKALLTAATLVIAFTSSAGLLAAQNDSAMQDCFKKHVQLMDKPAVKNMRDLLAHAWAFDGKVVTAG